MTTKDSILALAAKISGTTQDNVSTTAQALNKLAYAVTGQTPTTDLMTVDDCIAFITANYTPGGGGDFSTATVTYTLDDGMATIYAPYVFVSEDETAMLMPFHVINSPGGTVEVAMYGGIAAAAADGVEFAVVSGDATINEDLIMITGNCTIAFTQA